MIERRSTRGQVIATGEGYSSKAACMNGIESIRKNTPKADVVEVDK
ncbi:MAG: YegP family protein [bacterium]|nr:YegP family protein [bacterium]